MSQPGSSNSAWYLWFRSGLVRASPVVVGLLCGCGVNASGTDGNEASPAAVSQELFFDDTRTPAAPVQVRWLGAGGLEFSFDDQIFLIDPYFTRNVATPFVWFETVDPHGSRSLIEDYYATIGDPSRIKHIIVGHTHWDHSADVPLIAKRSGARVWGATSMKNLMAAYCMPSNVSNPEVGNYCSPQSQWSDPIEIGKTFELYADSAHRKAVDLTLYNWTHSDLKAMQLSGNISNVLELPATVERYRQGDVWAEKLTFYAGDGRSTTFLSVPSPILHPSIISIAQSGTIDVLFVSITNTGETEQAGLGAMIDMLHPRVTIPIHFDNYFQQPKISNEPQFVSTDRDSVDMDYLISVHENELHSDISFLESKGTESFQPALFQTLMAPAMPLSLIKLRSSDLCVGKGTSNVPMAIECGSGRTNTWLFDRSVGRLYEFSSGQCMNVVNGSVQFGACGSTFSTWSLSETGRLTTMVGTAIKCLSMTPGASATQPYLTDCTTDLDSSQRWSMLHHTYVQAQSNLDKCLTNAFSRVSGANRIQLGSCSRQFTYEPVTGYLRSSADPRYCVQTVSGGLTDGTELNLRLCSEGTDSAKRWAYRSSMIQARQDSSWCIMKTAANWTDGNLMRLAKCGSTPDSSMMSWSLTVSPGAGIGTVQGRILDGISKKGVSNVAVSIAGTGTDCAKMRTSSTGLYQCLYVPAGSRKVTVIPPAGSVVSPTSRTVTVRGEQTTTVADFVINAN